MAREDLRAAWREAWRSLVAQAANLRAPAWARVAGPIGATIATFHQLGWRAAVPEVWRAQKEQCG
eukprot:11212871-Lingulodinium_polyedra.AAC.1